VGEGAAAELTLWAVPEFPEVRAGDDLSALLLERLDACAFELRDGDVVVLAQKIVSKAEGRRVNLAQVVPSARAHALAEHVAKDARLVELILSESKRIVRAAKDVLIVEHRLGFVLANAGIDQSNVGTDRGKALGADDPVDYALLLPRDPDASAARICTSLAERTGRSVGVIINDSFGRAWRIGTVGVAIGVAGWPATLDLRGRSDRYGRMLRVTVVGHADEIASAASLLMGQANEGRPVVVVRGLAAAAAASTARSLLRSSAEDLFR
jgi:coenzyme F420-0:L-glutamate ligase/coenzyme F420-1:gamma-L-glutamate ligase